LQRAEDDGRGIQPGQGVAYVVVDDAKRSRDRVRLPDEAETYDAEFYVDQLLRAAESVLAPLGWRQDDIKEYLADHVDATLAAFNDGRHQDR
jgi:DNA polymerase I